MDDVCYYLVNLSWCYITFFILFLLCSIEPFLNFLTLFGILLFKLGLEFSELSFDFENLLRCAISDVFYERWVPFTLPKFLISDRTSSV